MFFGTFKLELVSLWCFHDGVKSVTEFFCTKATLLFVLLEIILGHLLYAYD